MNASQHCTTAATKANWMLGCTCRGVTGRDRYMIIPHYSVLARQHLDYSVQLWSPHFKTDRQTGGGRREGHKDDQSTTEPAL